jgi:hypothetical protein
MQRLRCPCVDLRPFGSLLPFDALAEIATLHQGGHRCSPLSEEAHDFEGADGTWSKAHGEVSPEAPVLPPSTKPRSSFIFKGSSRRSKSHRVSSVVSERGEPVTAWTEVDSDDSQSFKSRGDYTSFMNRH